MLGQGARTFVFRLAIGEDQKPHVLKMFQQQHDHDREARNLQRLHQILGGNALRRHIPQLVQSGVLVEETIHHCHFLAILTKQVCMPIRPRRGGAILRKDHYHQVLDTLQAVHAQAMFHCDVKPSNIMLDAGKAVLIDWGCAVYASEETPLGLRSVGTVGYSDFTLQMPAVASAAHDLMALVRTAFVNYTDQEPPSEQADANAFWTQCFHNTSLWTYAMQLAKEVKYDELKTVLGYL